jgi:chromosome partitioning protein
MARIMVITNRKGGTGKTTTAVNLAAEFAANGQRVLLVDLDTQSHCAIGLGVRINKGASTAHDLFTNGASLAAGIHGTNWPNLDLIPANPLFEHGSGSGMLAHLKRHFCRKVFMSLMT